MWPQGQPIKRYDWQPGSLIVIGFTSISMPEQHLYVIWPYAGAARNTMSCGAKEEVVISCLEPCQSPSKPALYPPITAGERLAERRRETIRSVYEN